MLAPPPPRATKRLVLQLSSMMHRKWQFEITALFAHVKAH